MPRMTLAFALYFECPRCARQIDVGESSEEVTSEGAQSLARKRGMEQMEGTCPGCNEQVTVSMKTLKSRARN